MIYLNFTRTTILGDIKIAKGPVKETLRKFIMITIARHKYVNVGTFRAVKTDYLPKRYTKRGGIYK